MGNLSRHESALGYLLTGGEALPSDLMMERWGHACKGCDGISIETLEMAMQQFTRLSRVEQRPPLLEPQLYTGRFERDWSVGSFSSLARRTGPTGTIGSGASSLPVPRDGLQENLLEGAGMGHSSHRLNWRLVNNFEATLQAKQDDYARR